MAWPPVRAETLVAAASSLRYVWPALMQAYPEPIKPRVSFGSSGNLLRQIEQGAPFNVFLSANNDYAHALLKGRWQNGHASRIASGKIAWLAPKNSLLGRWISGQKNTGDDNLQPFPAIDKLAIANPRFAPYGIAAEQAMASWSLDQLPSIQRALAENASQAVQFSLSGAIDGGIVAYPLLQTDAILNNSGLVFHPIDSSRHQAIDHMLVSPPHTTEETQKLLRFLRSEQAQTVLSQYGFDTQGIEE